MIDPNHKRELYQRSDAMSWLATLAPGIPIRICTASTTRVDYATVTAVTATEIRCGHRRFTLDGRGIGSAAWLEPFREPRPIGRPRKINPNE